MDGESELGKVAAPIASKNCLRAGSGTMSDTVADYRDKVAAATTERKTENGTT